MSSTIEIKTISVVDPLLKAEILERHIEERQVIIHASLNTSCHTGFNIYKSTYLIGNDSGDCVHKSNLLVAYKMVYHPQQFIAKPYSILSFTMVFEQMKKDIKVFNLVEITGNCNKPFYLNNILRNTSDVYHVEIKY